MIINTQMTKKGSSSKPVLIAMYIEGASTGVLGTTNNPYLLSSVEHEIDDSGPIVYAPPVISTFPTNSANHYGVNVTRLVPYGTDLPNGHYTVYVITTGGSTQSRYYGTVEYDYANGNVSNIVSSNLFKTVSGTTTHYVAIVDLTFTPA